MFSWTKIVTCIYLCRAAEIFNIIVTIFTSPITLAVSHQPPTSWCQTFYNKQSNHLAIANNAKQQWRCEYELKRDGLCFVLAFSTFWQSTGVAKAQKQIQTIPTIPTKFPSRGSGDSSFRSHMQVGVFALGLSSIVHIKIWQRHAFFCLLE